MHVNFDRGKNLLRVQFVGQDVSTLVNYLKPFRNNTPVGEWLHILEPLCAPLIEAEHECRFLPIQGDFSGQREGCSCGSVRIIEMGVVDEEDSEEEVQAEAFRQLGGKLEADENDEDGIAVYELPQVIGHSPEQLNVVCANCSMPQWRHVLGSDRCQVNGVALGTMFRAPMLLAAAEDEDEAVFAVTVGESEVRCG